MRRIIQQKKGFDSTQMLIYVVSIVVLGFVLLFGFRAITTFDSSQQDVIKAQFQTEFSSLVERVSTDHGRVDFFTVRLPSQYREICFVDVNEDSPSSCPTENLTQTICDDWKDFYENDDLEKQNVFFIDTNGFVVDTDFISQTRIKSPHYFCVTNRDNEIRLESQRRDVFISLAE